MLAFLLLVGAAQVPADHGGYWQQRVAYRITAALDESSGVLTGRARITYVNRSPDALHDLYVHQYLNAFRPHSRWAAVDSAEGRERFQHMKDPDYAFERISAATLMGAALKPDYPFAPDSTVAHWTLPQPLAPGDSLVADIAWQARPSTLPRRQGRRCACCTCPRTAPRGAAASPCAIPRRRSRGSTASTAGSPGRS